MTERFSQSEMKHNSASSKVLVRLLAEAQKLKFFDLE